VIAPSALGPARPCSPLAARLLYAVCSPLGTQPPGALDSIEEALDSREEALDSREEALDSREEALDSREEALDSIEEALDSREEARRVRAAAHWRAYSRSAD
jgi:hypothetical protein